MQFPSDRTAISALLDTLALDDSAQARVVRISNTLELAQLEISEPLAAVAKGNDRITIESDPFEWAFDPEDNLQDL
jgi:hypothetical protein